MKPIDIENIKVGDILKVIDKVNEQFWYIVRVQYVGNLLGTVKCTILRMSTTAALNNVINTQEHHFLDSQKRFEILDDVELLAELL